MICNWYNIDKCGVWRVLGVTECNNCPDVDKCWIPENELEVPVSNKELKGGE